MKVRYFLPLLMLLGLLTSCHDNDEVTYLDGLRVSSSYVTLDTAGGTATITLDADGDWAFEKIFEKTVTDDQGEKTTVLEPLPEWLTVSQLTGQAGQTELTFSAEATLDGRSTELQISCGGKTQRINVLQGLPVVSDATCADVIAGPESKTYRVTGTVTSIVNTLYGNWYLADDTGSIYIYGTLDEKGNTKNFLSWGLEVGDQITVTGPKTVYNGTVELVDVTVVEIVKSLVKVESVTPEDGTLPKEGGDYTIAITNKGTGLSVDIPEAARDWLSVASIAGGENSVVTLRARANQAGAREALVTFRTTDASGKEYTSQTTLKQEGSIVDVSVAEFLAAEVGSAQYRLTGVLTEQYTYDSQNKSYYIRDYSGTVLVYRAEGLLEAGAKVGDVVTVVGQRGAYKDSPQMVSGQVEKHITVTPIEIADFIELPDSDEDYYMISGMIDEIKNQDYGNVYLSDGDTSVYVYGCYPGWGATGDFRKGLLAQLGLDVGDGLTVIGTKTTYNGETELKNGIYFSHQK